MNIFKRAARAKLRFDSAIGLLSVENLFDLPLTARGARPDLDKLACGVYHEIKSFEEGSFVDDCPNPRKIELELMLEILKHVIESKKADRAAAEKKAENAARRERLLRALDFKEESELVGKSREELKAEIAALDA